MVGRWGALAWPEPAVIIILWAVGGGGVFCCCPEVPLQQLFWFGALPANAGLIVVMNLSPSVKNGKMVVAELRV